MTASRTSSTTPPASAYRDENGEITRVTLNGVSVTPLLPLLRGKETHESTASTASSASARIEPMNIMKITDIRFGMLRVPLKTPFKTALRTVDTVEDIVVTVHTDTGNIGYGEAPATAVITGDTHGSIVEAIRKFIAPRLIGEDIANLNRITQLIQTALEKNSSAKAAVEIAVYDLFGQLYNAPLYKMLGGGDPVVTTDITISVDYIDKMVADSVAAVERGFESLKIKVGKDIGVDIERVKAIYAAVEGPRAAAARRESGLDREASGLRAADARGCRRAAGAGRATGQGAGPRGHEVRHRARAHADHGG